MLHLRIWLIMLFKA